MKTMLFSSLRQAFQLAQLADTQPGQSLDDVLAECERHTLARRQFLKTGARAGMLLGLGGAGLGGFLEVAAGKPKEKIAIIGAGMAGLSAAYYLRQKGVIVTLFEGDQRAGGRIKSARIFDDGKLNTEIGAEFIDSQHADMLRFVRLLGLQDKVMDVQDDTLGLRDTFLIETQRRTLRDIVGELNAVYPQLARDQLRLDDARWAAQFDQLSMAEYLESLPLSRWMKKLLDAAFVGENGLETYDQSAVNFIGTIATRQDEFTPYGPSDERYKIIGGNEQIPSGLAKLLSQQIRYGHQLVALREKTNGTFDLTFSVGGATAEASFDVIVLALPFTVLRSVRLDMDLPVLKRRVIEELGYGTNAKFIVETKERTWRQNGYQGYLFNEQVSNGWDSSQLQQGNRGVGAYTVFYGGEQGKNARKGTEAAQLAYAIPALETAFPGTKASLSGKMELSHWTANPFVKGSYSCFGVGQATPFAGVAAEPVRNLYFAGEHCSEDYWGFMNGAAETGRLAAQAVLKKMRVK